VNRFIAIFLSLLGGGLLAGLITTGVAAQTPAATAQLRNAQGQVVGTANLTQQAGGVSIAVQAQGLPPGRHGIHIHDAGRCDPPDFTSAAGHFNPDGRQHGLQNPQGAHAGDLPNIEIAANGSGSLTAVAQRATLGPDSLGKPGGTALVVHADPDDERTDPTGNSGGRIACGVITVAQAGAGAPPAQTLTRTGQGASALQEAGIGGLLAVIGVVALVGGAFALRRPGSPRA
jgi:Cu-Zn family superoxide dismutase